MSIAVLCSLAAINILNVNSLECDAQEPTDTSLTLDRKDHWLIIRGPQLPAEIRINYLEAYCRPNSTDADWDQHTVIGHESELIELSEDRRTLRLQDTLRDGVIVTHTITATVDEVEFVVEAHNPTDQISEAHWAQPCVRLAAFTGFDPDGSDIEDYLHHCFLFLDGELCRMPTPKWSTQARYTPGQVWCPHGVPRSDVNPRPLNPLVTSNGLIGAFSKDEKMIFATAWEPYQELFQGVARCLHSDFRIGGLQPDATKTIRGKIYLIPNDIPDLLRRYQQDFSE